MPVGILDEVEANNREIDNLDLSAAGAGRGMLLGRSPFGFEEPRDVAHLNWELAS